MSEKIILTVQEIRELAQGVKDDDGSILHTRFIAYYDDIPEDGCMPLGKPITG